jgi:hypothetical protein
VVPGQVVDFSPTNWPGRRRRATCAVAASAQEWSGCRSGPSGVGTQIKTASASARSASPPEREFPLGMARRSVDAGTCHNGLSLSESRAMRARGAVQADDHAEAGPHGRQRQRQAHMARVHHRNRGANVQIRST